MCSQSGQNKVALHSHILAITSIASDARTSLAGKNIALFITISTTKSTSNTATAAKATV